MPTTPVKLSEQLAICQHVAGLVKSKLPIAGQLTPVALNSQPSLVTTARKIDQQLVDGQSLQTVLTSDPSRNSRMLAACIEVGELSGKLDLTLEQWTEMHLHHARDRHALRTAMLYPSLMIVVTIASLGYVIWSLIPQYRDTFALFTKTPPGWLTLLMAARNQAAWLLPLILAAILAPIGVWLWRRSGVNKLNLPRERAQRMQVQALACEMLQIGLSTNLPLNRLVRLSVQSAGGGEQQAGDAFALIQNHQSVPQLAKETSIVVSALHAGYLTPREAGLQLGSVSRHLKQQAENATERSVRWLPMLVALAVGGATILTYVFLVYLPWVSLLMRMVAIPQP